ncbi:MAG TPA: hypothetical protein VLJ10_02655, partial [Candidatus Bathyarchaeia archaeon]|nr:hypothetical protein [Candidatus Bathyarchaeia archaeon]
MQILIGFGGIVLTGYLVCLFLQRFSLFNNTACSGRGVLGWRDSAFWKKVWNHPEIRRRIYITLGIVIFYKLLIFIPTPGVNIAGISEIVERMQVMAPDHPVAQVSQNPLFSKVYRQFSFFHIGLIPYLSACIFFQFLGVVIRPWRRAMFSGNGRQVLIRWTFILALVLSVIQSLFYAFSLEQMHIDEMAAVIHPGWLFRTGVMLSMTAGFCLVFWLANTITKKGIGNGIAIFVCADILLRVFGSLGRLFGDIARGQFQPIYYVLAFLAVLLMLLLVFRLTTWRRDLEFQIGEARRCFSMRLSDMANIPVVLAMFVLFLPATISSFADYPLMRSLAQALVRGSVFYYL